MLQGEGKQAAVQRDSTSAANPSTPCLTSTILFLLFLLLTNCQPPFKVSLCPSSSTTVSSLPCVSTYHPTKLTGGQGGQGDMWERALVRQRQVLEAVKRGWPCWWPYWLPKMASWGIKMDRCRCLPTSLFFFGNLFVENMFIWLFCTRERDRP